MFDIVVSIVMATFMATLLVYSWLIGALKDVIEERNREMKEGWPIVLGITVVALLPFTIALICGKC